MGMERCIITALSLLSELFEYALGADLDELSSTDREVLIDQADCAGRHATNILFLHRPLLRKLAPEQRSKAIDKLFLRHPYEVDCQSVTETEHLLSLANLAYNELIELLEAPKRTISREADFALSHLDVLRLLLAPGMYAELLEEASADERVRIAAQAEQVELMLEESRALAHEDGSFMP